MNKKVYKELQKQHIRNIEELGEYGVLVPLTLGDEDVYRLMLMAELANESFNLFIENILIEAMNNHVL